MPRTPDGHDLILLSDVLPQYTAGQETSLHILVIAFSSFSIASGILSLYWFIIMRRTFRHDLIMFLIQSDMFKACWMVVYGIASLMPGQIDSLSPFCQVDGFFTSLAVEASDIAVLMISLHNALYIFYPPATVGEGGLYPYRHLALSIWIALPIFMASVAFTNPHGGYSAGVTGCYPPLQPLWYQLALSWLPRYVIFVTILGLDIAIYAYIRYIFRDVWKAPDVTCQLTRNMRRGKYMSDSDGQQKFYNNKSVPTTPRLAYNGLLPDTRQASIASRVRRWNTELKEEPKPWRSQSEGVRWAPKWTNSSLRRHTVEAAPNSAFLDSEADMSLADVRSVSDLVLSPTAMFTPKSIIPLPKTPSWMTLASPFGSQPGSRVSILSFLRIRPRHSGHISNNSSLAPQLKIPEESRLEMRDRIQHQLRFLFFYPLAYMGMWIIPFIAHIYQYTDTYTAKPPFAITALASILLASQCAVDCWIFSIREKPWVSTTEGMTAWKSPFVFLKNWTLCSRGSSQRARGWGKSRAQLAADARVAYARRDEERATRASEMSVTGRTGRRERSWWDESDGGSEHMSILFERNACLLDELYDSARN